MLGLEAVIPGLSKVVSGGMAVVGLNRLWDIRLEEPLEGVELNPNLNPALYQQNVWGNDTSNTQPAVLVQPEDAPQVTQAELQKRLEHGHRVLQADMGLLTDVHAHATLERRVLRGEDPDKAAHRVADTYMAEGDDGVAALNGFVNMAVDAAVLDIAASIGDRLLKGGRILGAADVSAQDAANFNIGANAFAVGAPAVAAGACMTM